MYIIGGGQKSSPANNGLPSILPSCFPGTSGATLTRPAALVGFEQPFEMVPEALCDPQHSEYVRRSRQGCSAALVCRASNLVEIPANGPELCNASLECRELLLG